MTPMLVGCQLLHALDRMNVVVLRPVRLSVDARLLQRRHEVLLLERLQLLARLPHLAHAHIRGIYANDRLYSLGRDVREWFKLNVD
jgi:hypothetical protein